MFKTKIKMRCVLAILIILTLTLGAAAAKNRSEQETVTFLDKVRSLVDIRAAGNQPFHLRARIESAPLAKGGEPFIGSLVLTWQSPSQWREETSFPGYNQVRVFSQGKLWTSRNLAFEPLRVFQVSELMDLSAPWKVRPDESASGVKNKKQNGTPMQCVEIQGEREPTRRVCADSTTLLPARVEPQSSVDLSRPSYEYASYMPWNGKQFPREMRVYEDGNLVVTMHTELAAAADSDPSVSPPPQAGEWDWCDDPNPPKVADGPPPNYPTAERNNRAQGMASVYALVGTDGFLSRLAIVRPASPGFNEAALGSIKRWRYRPATCGVTRVPYETIIDMRFTIHQ